MKLNIWLALILALGASSAYAESGSSQTGFEPFVGFGAGYARSDDDSPSVTLDGLHLMIQALGAFRTENWVHDLGLGWQRSKVNGSNSGLAFDVLVKSGFAQYSPRYLFKDSQWQLGPVVELMFGTDVTFATVRNSSGTAIFGGGELVYEIPFQKTDLRVFGKAEMDLTISGRKVSIFVAGLQLGFRSSGDSEPVRAASPAPVQQAEVMPAPYPPAETMENLAAPAPAPAPVPSPVVAAAPAPVPADVGEAESEPRAEVVVSLSADKLLFETNHWELGPAVVNRLSALGKELSRGTSAWGQIEVAGHTDSRGKMSFNQKLSERRAQSVANALRRGGIPTRRLKIKGYSYTRPVDKRKTPLAYARNRRVELIFQNVKDAGKVQDMLRDIKTRFGTGESSQ